MFHKIKKNYIILMKLLVKCATATIFGGMGKKGKELGWLREGEGGEEGLPARLEYLKNRVWVGGSL